MCGERGAADFLLNVALFLPFGAALRYAGLRTAAAVAIALALSAAIEVVQLGLPGRYTTVGDLAANGLGGFGGALMMGTGALSPRSPPSLRGQVAATALVAGLWIVSSAAFTVSLPRTDYYGQWTADLGHYEHYQGAVLQAEIGGRPAPSWRLPPESRARAALLSGDTLRVVVRVGPAPTDLAPIFSVYDQYQNEILVLGADGDDVLLRVRRAAADLRLATPLMRWPDALAGVETGDTVQLAAWREGPARMCMRVRTVRVQNATRCEAPGVSRGWTLLLEATRVPPALRPIGDALWLGGGAIVALAWAPGLAAGAVGAGFLAAVVVLTRIALT